MKLAAITILAAAAALSGCGGSGDGDQTTQATALPSSAATGAGAQVTGELPQGAVGPADSAGELDGSAAGEASPEAEASGPESTGELEGSDRSGATAAVRDYIGALDRRNAARVCALIAPGGLDLSELPRRQGGCRASVRASIGTEPSGGGPAWRRTQLVELKPEALGDDRARITATVTHRFSDRKYVSVEDDVIYTERAGGSWRLAKPSATFYRAVGYAEPPLRAFSPPPGW